MFKYVSALIIFISSAYAYMCDSIKIINSSIIESSFYYDKSNKLIINTYTSPINMVEYIDYTNKIKYKICSESGSESVCDAELYFDNFPELYHINTDILIDTIDNVQYYNRTNDNILSYSIKDGYIYDIYYSDLTYQRLINCHIEDKPNINLSICPAPTCSKIADIIFVIDESGSIIEEEYDKIKTFIIDIINHYDLSQDTVNIGIVLFAESSRVISSLSYNKNNLITSINNMGQYKGGTCISCGLDTAYNLLQSKSDYRKSLNPENIIITLTDGMSNKPVKDNRNKRYYDQYHCSSYGNCKKSCTDNSTIYYQKCSSFCSNTNKNKCIGNTCYIYSDRSWYYDTRNNKCNINNYVYRSDCCVNGADDCCCEEVPVIGGCWSGDYDNKALPKSANKIKSSNIQSIAVGVRDASIDELKTFSDNVYSINSYNDLITLKESLIKDTCTSITYTSCNKDCLGFCGCSKKCYCPKCIDTNDECTKYECTNNDFSSSGCILSEIECDDSNDCLILTKDSTYEGCCKYTDKVCTTDNKCKINKCSPLYGCYTEDLVCDDFNPCTIDTCDPEYGCIHTINNNLCDEYEICINISNTDYMCSDNCSNGAPCKDSDVCGDWECINDMCVFKSKCIPDSCHILVSCDPSLEEPCIYKEIECIDPDECHINGKCINGECIYENKTCTSNNLCKENKCDPLYGCYTEDIICSTDDLCSTSYCVENKENNSYYCESISKCEYQVCKNIKCSLDGECIYTDITCDDDYNDTCFIYMCENDTCVPNVLNISVIDPCGDCIKKYHELGYYLEYNDTLCESNKKTFDFDIVAISAGVIAAIVVCCTVAATAITAGSVLGVKELIKRANAMNDVGAHSNPLYEPNDNEMVNPMVEEL